MDGLDGWTEVGMYLCMYVCMHICMYVGRYVYIKLCYLRSSKRKA